MLMNPFDIVKIARDAKRPGFLEYADYLFTDFIEFHGDRNFGDDKAIVTGIAKLDNLSVTVIANQKGDNLNQNLQRNFGQPKPEGYRKSLRMLLQAEKFNRPVITFINTPGAYAGLDAEKRGQASAISNNLKYMSQLKVPIISVLIGEGGSGGALAIGVSDKIFMLKYSIYSILSPEGFASILWKDAKKAPKAAELMKLTSSELMELKVIDKIIDEVDGGAQNDIQYTANLLKGTLIAELNMLLTTTKNKMLDDRYNKFRSIGDFNI